jgi:hypothetical protein
MLIRIYAAEKGAFPWTIGLDFLREEEIDKLSLQ